MNVLAILMDIEFVDWIRFGSLIIAFLLLAVFSDRRTWITTDLLITLGWGLCMVIAPGFSLGYLVQSLEDPMMHEHPEKVETGLSSIHLLLCRLSGIIIMCLSILRFMTRESRDGTVHISILMSRVFTNTMIVICQVYSYYLSAKGKKSLTWTPEFVKMSIFGSVLWLLGSLLHLLRSNDFMTYPQHNIRLNSHLRVDAWLATVMGMLCLAFPEYLLRLVFGLGVSKTDAIHLHLMRCIGALYLGEAVISIQAPGFLHERDKRAQFLGRFIPQLLLMVPLLWAFLISGIISRQQLLWLIGFSVPALANAMFAYFTDGTVIYHVPQRDDSAKKD